MYATVTQLAVVQVGLLGAFACQFCHARHCLAFFLALLYLLQHHVGHVLVFVQEVIDFCLYEVTYVFVYAHAAVGCHGERAEFYFRLTFKHWLLNVYGNGRHKAVAYVAVFEVLVEEFLYRLGYVLFECALVRTALSGVLTIDKRMVLLAILVGVSESNFDVFAFQVDYGIETVARHVVVEQVFKSVAAKYASAVVHNGKPRVEIGVVAEHRLNYVVVELIIEEKRGVGFEEYECSVFVVSRLGSVGCQLPLFECCLSHRSVAVGAHFEV